MANLPSRVHAGHAVRASTVNCLRTALSGFLSDVSSASSAGTASAGLVDAGAEIMLPRRAGVARLPFSVEFSKGASELWTVSICGGTAFLDDGRGCALAVAGTEICAVESGSVSVFLSKAGTFAVCSVCAGSKAFKAQASIGSNCRFLLGAWRLNCSRVCAVPGQIVHGDVYFPTFSELTISRGLTARLASAGTGGNVSVSISAGTAVFKRPSLRLLAPERAVGGFCVQDRTLKVCSCVDFGTRKIVAKVLYLSQGATVCWNYGQKVSLLCSKSVEVVHDVPVPVFCAASACVETELSGVPVVCFHTELGAGDICFHGSEIGSWKQVVPKIGLVSCIADDIYWGQGERKACSRKFAVPVYFSSCKYVVDTASLRVNVLSGERSGATERICVRSWFEIVPIFPDYTDGLIPENFSIGAFALKNFCGEFGLTEILTVSYCVAPARVCRSSFSISVFCGCVESEFAGATVSLGRVSVERVLAVVSCLNTDASAGAVVSGVNVSIPVKQTVGAARFCGSVRVPVVACAEKDFVSCIAIHYTETRVYGLVQMKGSTGVKSEVSRVFYAGENWSCSSEILAATELCVGSSVVYGVAEEGKGWTSASNAGTEIRGLKGGKIAQATGASVENTLYACAGTAAQVGERPRSFEPVFEVVKSDISGKVLLRSWRNAGEELTIVPPFAEVGIIQCVQTI